MQEDLKDKSDSQLESWFLESLAAEHMPLDHMLALLNQLIAGGKAEIVNSWTDLLQEELKERGDGTGMFRLIKTVSKWRQADPDFRSVCRNALSSVFKDRIGVGFIAAAGFDQNIHVMECIRRFELLNELKPGRFCYEKTWGFGVVQKTDDFYQKIIIDFNSKKAHQMSFAYASEALELIGNDHVLAMKHSNSAGLNDLVKNRPAEVVKMAIRDYGPVTAPRLKELLVDVVNDTDWKNFWDGARKVLKNDSLVDLPAKRSDPIRLREKHRAYDEAWFNAFRAEKDLERLFLLIDELESAVDDPVLIGQQWKVPLADRFAFMVKGCFSGSPDKLIKVVLAAKIFGLDNLGAGGIDGPVITKSLFAPEQFLLALARLPARDIGSYIAHMSENDQQQTADVMFSLIPHMSIGILNEAMNFLFKSGREDDCAEFFRTKLMAKNAGPSMLLWVCRNLDRVAHWGLVNVSELLAQVLDDIKDVKSGDDLKSQNQLRILMEQKAWIEGVLSMMTPLQRSDFVTRINAARGFDDSSKRSLLALMIKVYPELKQVLSGKDRESGGAEVSPRGRFTSWRSYRERQEQYRILVEKRIPENSRDIAVARSYGDLRENHEYKTAKEMQGIFLKRQGEMEEDLKAVKGTDFAGMPCDKIGMGTCITIRRPDGKEQVFAILGEWDRDEQLGIISNESRVAKLLEGLAEGAKVDLPAGGGANIDEPCTVVKISGLTDAVRLWVNGTAGDKKDSP
ncbi:MAG: hypothetical protein A2283_17200 [Lentisphaerae bacterium RIFOXYA12_FULL_48_11]|nr:MAG: hypothetical protein A2283_17200 [Lentisphaerae bacterium RIFOXYA12_FULL_48_11]